MVEDVDLQQLPGADEVAGDGEVGLGGGGVAAGVVVDEDERGGVGGDGGAEDLAGVDEGGVEDAGGDALGADEAAAGVEQDDVEFLDLLAAKLVAQMVGDGRGVIKLGAGGADLGGHAAGEGEGGLEGDSLVAADALDLLEILEAGLGEGMEVAVVADELAADVEGGLPAQAGAQEDGDELGVGKSISAEGGEAFARALKVGQILDARGVGHGANGDCLNLIGKGVLL